MSWSSCAALQEKEGRAARAGETSSAVPWLLVAMKQRQSSLTGPRYSNPKGELHQCTQLITLGQSLNLRSKHAETSDLSRS